MANLVCPVCGVPTSLSPVVLEGKGIVLADERLSYSPLAGSVQMITYEGVELRSFSTKQSLVALKAVTDEKYMTVEGVCYAILICQTCGQWFVARKEEESVSPLVTREWTAVYPIPRQPVAEEIPEPIKSEFEEAQLCFAVGAYRACVTICMVALEALWHHQGVSGLNQLKDDGIISARLFDQATEIRLWAGIVKHELIHEPVGTEEAQELLTYLEAIFDTVYVQPARLDALAKKREKLKKDSKPKPSAPPVM